MVSTTDAVQDRVERDVILHDALARGIVNLRALARWMQQECDVPGSIEAIVTALRRHDARKSSSRLVDARGALLGAHVNVRSDMCAIVLSRTSRVVERLPALVEAIDVSAGATLRIVPGDRSITAVVDADSFPVARDALGAGAIEQRVEDLVELAVVSRPECGETPGVLALIMNALAVRGINVRFCHTGWPEQFILVSHGDHGRAFHILTDLMRAAEE